MVFWSRNEEFQRWLADNHQLRPFVWLHLLLPHYPYTPSLRLLPKRYWKLDSDVTPSQLYDAEVRETDEAIARILETIDTNVGLDRSLVIFISDHGEEFGEHGMWEHGHSVHGEVIEVPLMLAGPGIPAGRRVSSQVSTVDLLPTLLSYIGADSHVPPTAEGRNLLPLVAGREEDGEIYSDGMLYGSTERCFISNGFKLMFDAQGKPAYRLFNILTDPGENTDVAHLHRERVETLRSTMLEWHSRFVDDYEKTISRDAAEPNPETQRVLRALRALGYISE
jgi:arylsulfatase A-like enzyme